ncbi:hypothetical protein ANCCAN_20081 [Ancylostoma caninum]|uniref:Uncharacterized protein n=1 Tax=Ancylostoma caninum TaxID=29170 RepID=A0A368FUZ1_ANCCA|nr:hypothetical protein ANCCAN_20081 [Ancylostoma caninum]
MTRSLHKDHLGRRKGSFVSEPTPERVQSDHRPSNIRCCSRIFVSFALKSAAESKTADSPRKSTLTAQ